MEEESTKVGQDVQKTTVIDCSEGRRMGCNTFCCRLIVRLKEHERPQFDGMGTVGKDDDGLCQHLDRKTYLCAIWEKRPSVCKEYTCNDDFLLQVVLREGFTDLKSLAMSKLFVPKESFIHVPKLKD